MEQVRALGELISLLSALNESDYAALIPQEMIEYAVNARYALITGDVSKYRKLMKSIVVPTGSAQDISIDNGWGQRFLELCSIFEA
jgi:hypothetical protein